LREPNEPSRESVVEVCPFGSSADGGKLAIPALFPFKAESRSQALSLARIGWVLF